MLVRDHGWVFFYTTPVDFAMWHKAFKANGFQPLAYPWVMIRDTDTVQMNTSPIPQNISELLIGARKAGLGHPEHQPDITSRYERSVSLRKRKFAIMDNCPEPRLKFRKPTSREPIRSNQRSAEPIAEFLETFCPQSGNVLDAFAGTMETAKACFMTGRKCVALEADDICYNVALQALKENASAYLEQNTIPVPRSTEVSSERDWESNRSEELRNDNEHESELRERERRENSTMPDEHNQDRETASILQQGLEPALSSPVTSDGRQSLEV